MQQQVTIRFYEELNDFLPVHQRKKDLRYELKKPRSIKDLIESIGVPHTEIDLIIVNGDSVDLNYPVQADDRISVYPVFESLDISPLVSTRVYCQPKPLRTTRFILDVHLGRLAAYLRMLGFDTLYRNDYNDPELADISASEHRILLTCDRQLLMRKQITHGYFVRSRQPEQQLQEILARFDLYNNLKPFSRCIHCNGTTRQVSKQDVAEKLETKTRKYYNEFYQCETCKKIYWKGSHFLKMQKMISKLV